MRTAVGSALLLIALEPIARAQPRYGARIEAGAEYDSNPQRLERIDNTPRGGRTTPSPLGRLVLDGDLAAPLGTRALFRATGGVAGKWFSDPGARAEDVVVAHASAAQMFLVAARSSLTLAGGYYDVFQRDGADARHFRSLSPTLRFEQSLLTAAALTLGGGYRWFAYKPEQTFDFSGPSAFVAFRQALLATPAGEGADWEWSTSVSIEQRTFSSPRFACGSATGSGQRLDRFWVGGAEVTRTGGFLVGIGAGVHVNDSNSCSESLARALAHLRAAVLLPWQLALSGRAELVALRYSDPIHLGPIGQPFSSIEEESRSTARLELARPFGDFDVGVRYTLHTNELRSGPVQYRRQTALLFVALDIFD